MRLRKGKPDGVPEDEPGAECWEITILGMCYRASNVLLLSHPSSHFGNGSGDVRSNFGFPIESARPTKTLAFVG